jgi:putative hydrolase of the HAD superfamily
MDQLIYNRCVDVIKTNSSPITPIPTDLQFHNAVNTKIEAVLFDVYGTLFVSSSGDIGTIRKAANAEMFEQSLRSAGSVILKEDTGKQAAEHFFATIEAHHENLKFHGIEYPEIDILDIWINVCTTLQSAGYIEYTHEDSFFCTLAVEHETKTNPVWPMADLNTFFSRLGERNIPIGIISNAQFYTPLLFPALAGKTACELGFQQELTAWSYTIEEAKPSPRLFHKVVDNLQYQYGIYPESTLYIGNDMKNDIAAAQSVGCKAALFAGDKRSLRLRVNDDCCKNIEPDAILTVLDDLFNIV